MLTEKEKEFLESPTSKYKRQYRMKIRQKTVEALDELPLIAKNMDEKDFEKVFISERFEKIVRAVFLERIKTAVTEEETAIARYGFVSCKINDEPEDLIFKGKVTEMERLKVIRKIIENISSSGEMLILSANITKIIDEYTQKVTGERYIYGYEDIESNISIGHTPAGWFEQLVTKSEFLTTDVVPEFKKIQNKPIKEVDRIKKMKPKKRLKNLQKYLELWGEQCNKCVGEKEPAFPYFSGTIFVNCICGTELCKKMKRLLEKAEEELKLCEAQLKKSPNDVDVLYSYGHALMKRQKYEDAKRVFQKIIRMDENYKNVKRILYIMQHK